jgi:bacterioferritin (cytochrome b1)
MSMDKISKAQQSLRFAQSLLGEITRTPEAIKLLQEALKAEFQQWDLYYAYKNQLRGLSREPIADHFEEHAQDEADHIEILQRYLVSMGEQPTKQREPIPEVSADIMKIIALQYKFEIKAVKTYQSLLIQLEDNDPLRIEIENILAKEMEHAQDLELLFKQTRK